MCDRPNCFVDGGFTGTRESQQNLLLGFGLDPVESAITNAAQAAKEADGMSLMILQRHLKQLCELQLKQLSSK
jgi:hypothetical protein